MNRKSFFKSGLLGGAGLLLPGVLSAKGNHDYLEAGQTRESVWGYSADQIVEAGPLAFIFADTSRGDNLDATVYTSPDPEWMQNALRKVSGKEAVIIVLHIAQRREGGDGWPEHINMTPNLKLH